MKPPPMATSTAKLALVLSYVLPLLASPLLTDLKQSADGSSRAPKVAPGSSTFWLQLAFIAFLVLLGGCFAGLTLGLMGLDQLNLQVLATSGTEKEKVQAARVLRLLEKGRHWVLVVLLLSNVVVNETLPIFLDSVLGGGVWAIVLSTTLIVIFGEIIPQSVCVRYGLAIGAKSAPFVLALMYLEFPIAYPIAKLLDYLLGHDEGTTYRKAELKTFVGLHRHIGTDGLNEDEVLIITSVLDLSTKTIADIMTPIEDTFTLGANDILDENTVTELLSQGYSRVPIHEPGHDRNFIGMLLVKELISYDPEDAKPVHDFQLRILPEAAPDMTCLEALNFFQQGRSHMLLVSSQPGEDRGALGIVSLEDVIEEMIGEEIVDETDNFIDIAHKIRVVRKPMAARGPVAKGLAPLIKGVVEKRRSQVAAGGYGAVEDGGKANSVSHSPSSALNKVRMKGGEATPVRRPQLKDTTSRVSVITEEAGEEGAGPGGEAGEDMPLLSRDDATADGPD